MFHFHAFPHGRTQYLGELPLHAGRRAEHEREQVRLDRLAVAAGDLDHGRGRRVVGRRLRPVALDIVLEEDGAGRAHGRVAARRADQLQQQNGETGLRLDRFEVGLG